MAEELNILFHDEVQFLDFGESRTTGPWIKLRLRDPDDLAIFRAMDPGEMKRTNHVLHCTIASGDIATVVPAEEPPGKKYGQFWRSLIRSGFFRAPPVLAAIGTEDEFEEWIREQPSVIGGGGDWVEELGERRCQPAHVRRVSEGSGTATKPPYFAVPMTSHEHNQVQHQHGYSRVTGLEAGEAIEWLAKKADQYRTEWASLTLASKLVPDTPSRGHVHPELVLLWVEENSLERFLPKAARDRLPDCAGPEAEDDAP